MDKQSIRASYVGTFEHSFDAKGRVTVPTEWRDESYESRLHAFESREGCVKVYPASWLSRLQSDIATTSKIDAPQRRRLEALASLAQATTWDGQGRIMVKERLRKKAGLQKDAVLVGCLDHFEVWNQQAFAARPQAQITLEEAVESLGL